MCPTAFLKQNWWIGASIFLEKDTWMYRIITIYMVTYTRLCIIHKYIYVYIYIYVHIMIYTHIYIYIIST